MYILYNWSDTQEADWFIDNIVPTNRRNQIVDLTLPWLYDYYAFVIPIDSDAQLKTTRHHVRSTDLVSILK
jgi:hypothetical protein